MRVTIDGNLYEYSSDFDPVDIIGNGKRGWRVSAGDYFKFPVQIGTHTVFVKRFNKTPQNISGLQLLKKIQQKKTTNLPIVHDVVQCSENNTTVFYLFLEYLKGDTLDNLNKNGFELNPWKLYADISKAIESLSKQGFWFPDFDPKNILFYSGSYYIIDLDSAYPLTQRPSPFMWGAKNFWTPVYTLSEEIGISEYAKKISGHTLNQWNLIYLLTLYSRYINTEDNDLTGASSRLLNEYIRSNDKSNQFLSIFSHSIKSNTLLSYIQIEKIIGSHLNFADKKQAFFINQNQQRPFITFFESDKYDIQPGEKAVLKWGTSRAEKSFLSNIQKTRNTNSFTVTPRKTAIYKIIAENKFGKTEKELKIEVLSPPKITQFTCSENKVLSGNNVVLSWEAENAARVQIHYLGKIETLPSRGQKRYLILDTTSFKLVLTSADTKTQVDKTLRVEVIPPTKILRFTCTPEEILSNQTIKIEWATENAEKVQLHYSGKLVALNKSGSLNLNFQKSTDIYLTSEGVGGSIDRKQIFIKVNSIPVFKTFRASKIHLLRGQGSQLNWNIEYSVKNKLVTNSNELFVDEIGILEIAPNNTTTYKLVATALDGITQFSQEVTVEVHEAVEIKNFSVSAEKIIEGNTVRVLWRTLHAQSVELHAQGTVHKVASIGVKDIICNKNDEIRLVVLGFDNKPVEQSARIKVLPKAKIDYFKTSSPSIQAGQTTLLTWQVRNASRVTLEYNGTTRVMNPIDSLEVNPTTPTSYRLIARSLDDETIVSQSIKINIEKPVTILYFFSSSKSIQKRKPITIQWEVSGATKIELVSSLNGIRDVTNLKKCVVSPSDAETFVLIAKNSISEVASESITVTIDNPIKLNYLLPTTLAILFSVVAIYYFLILPSKIDNELNLGLTAVEKEQHDLAIAHFKKAASYNRSTVKMDSLSRMFSSQADKDCEFLKARNANHLLDVANHNYQYAAALRNQPPSVCQ